MLPETYAHIPSPVSLLVCLSETQMPSGHGKQRASWLSFKGNPSPKTMIKGRHWARNLVDVGRGATKIYFVAVKWLDFNHQTTISKHVSNVSQQPWKRRGTPPPQKKKKEKKRAPPGKWGKGHPLCGKEGRPSPQKKQKRREKKGRRLQARKWRFGPHRFLPGGRRSRAAGP